ncbi:DUF1643 domain-containing protein [Acinetobacter pittii]|uniref:DUF1643 domain-containing protein n=1 Tax=Acinetobacter pittii TaxID=48296 RepID=UPI0005C5D5E1|nr:DUF1643 domain-containing protein [Acinetobacter pittii]
MNKNIKSAVLSECEQYRYVLTRGECLNPLVFIMLNPSTADHSEDDPTIRRCIGFAEDNGFDGLVVLNLYALRSTNPANLWESTDPIGDMNDFHILSINTKEIVCAWGKCAKADRVQEVLGVLKAKNIAINCLGVNKDNSPKHPLYLSKKSKIIKWEWDKNA